MDDFRKRYDVPRRDYSVPPQSQPGQPPAPSRSIPINSEPAQQSVSSEPVQPVYQQTPAPQSEPVQFTEPVPDQYLPPAATLAPMPVGEPAFHRPSVPSASDTEVKKKPRFKLGLKHAGIAAAVLLVVVGAGSFILKPSKTAAVTPADLAKKASFSVYYPSSLPAGYTYNASLATFENNGAYYTFVNGPKHIIIRENVNSSGKLETNEVTNPQPLHTSVGTAVIGTNTGQTAAAVLAGGTYVFIYSNGSVAPDDITAVVNQLKNISPTK